MALPWQPRRTSNSSAPNFSAKRESLNLLSGKKKSPTEADYKPASADSKIRCHECVNYTKHGEAESDCKAVVGIVRAEGICDLFKQREYTETDKPTEITVQVTHGG